HPARVITPSPPRRSSDLGCDAPVSVAVPLLTKPPLPVSVPPVQFNGAAIVTLPAPPSVPLCRLNPASDAGIVFVASILSAPDTSSEAHTSELQSLRPVVF